MIKRVENSGSMMIICVSVCVFAVMLHGLPISKVKRESSPTKELSPCRKLQADMCLYSYRYKNQCVQISARCIRRNKITLETVNTETRHFLLVSSPSVPVTPSQLGLKLWIQPPRRCSVAPPIPLDLHLRRGICNLPPLSWPITAPQATFLPWAPPTTTTSHRPTKASTLLCHVPPSAAPVRLSAQNQGEFWLVRFVMCFNRNQVTSNAQCSSTFQVSAAAVGALRVFPPPGESREQTVPTPELWWTTTVPAAPFGAPGFPRPPRFQTGSGGPAVPRARTSRAGCGPGPSCLQPRHNQTRAERLRLRLGCVDYYILESHFFFT